MVTITDSLLEDLEELNEFEEKENENNVKSPMLLNSQNYSSSLSVYHMNINDLTYDKEMSSILETSETINNNYISIISSLNIKRKRLLDVERLVSHLSSIRSFSSSDLNNSINQRPFDQRAHELMTTSNKYLSLLTHEIHLSHVDLSKAYEAKFPELIELLPDPILYRNTVSILRNISDPTIVNNELNNVHGLSSGQIITISVAGSNTLGRVLTNSELLILDDCINYMDKVIDVIKEITLYVEYHVTTLAPNGCALLGSRVMARVIGAAGGLIELSRIPACNLHVLGRATSTRTSISTLASSIIFCSGSSRKAEGEVGFIRGKNVQHTLHSGALAECDLYHSVPLHWKRKALKLIASKLALASRCDAFNVERRITNCVGSIGRRFRREIEEKVQSWDEPQKAPIIKALSKPDLTTKKRRGGKRIRRLKERFEETELMKQVNRRIFSGEVGEYGDDAMGLTLGMLEARRGTCNVRNAVSKSVKMRKVNTKASRKHAQAEVVARSKPIGRVRKLLHSCDGLASSMVFTPVQGLELVNPDASKSCTMEKNYKWFG